MIMNYPMDVKLVSKMKNSGNARVSFLSRQCRILSRSIRGGNLKIIGNVLGVEMLTDPVHSWVGHTKPA